MNARSFLAASLSLASPPVQAADLAQYDYLDVSTWRAEFAGAEQRFHATVQKWRARPEEPPPGTPEEESLVAAVREARGAVLAGTTERRFLREQRLGLLAERSRVRLTHQAWAEAAGSLEADQRVAEARVERARLELVNLLLAGSTPDLDRVQKVCDHWWEARREADWASITAHVDDVVDEWDAEGRRLDQLGGACRDAASAAGGRVAEKADDMLRLDGQVWLDEPTPADALPSVYGIRVERARHARLRPGDPAEEARISSALAALDQRLADLDGQIRLDRATLRKSEDALLAYRETLGELPAGDPLYSDLRTLGDAYDRLWVNLESAPVIADTATLCRVLVHGSVVRVLLEDVDAQSLIDTAAGLRGNACEPVAAEHMGLPPFLWAWTDAMRRVSELPTVRVVVHTAVGQWTVDGGAVAGGTQAPLELKEGLHRVVYQGPDRRIAVRKIDLYRGEPLAILFRGDQISTQPADPSGSWKAPIIITREVPVLEPAPDLRVPRLRLPEWFAFAGGVAVTSAGAGLALDSYRLSRNADAELNPDIRAYIQRRADVQRSVGLVMLGVGIPATGASVYLLVPRRDAPVGIGAEFRL